MFPRLYCCILLIGLVGTIAGDEAHTGCNSPADIAVIMDGSNSIVERKFNFQKRFALWFMWKFFDIDIDRAHGALLQYAEDVKVEFDFNFAAIQRSYFKTAGTVRQMHGDSRNAHLALETVRTEVFNTNNGARAGVPKFCFLFMDGPSSVPEETLQQAELLKDVGVILIAVAIGNEVDIEEMNAIVTQPPEEHFVNVPWFGNSQKYEGLLRNMFRRACSGVTA